MPRQENVDFYQVDSLLTDEERAFRDKVRKFVDEECLPVIAEHFDKGTFPLALIPRMASLGLFGIHFDGYGCTKASHTIYGLICQELGRCDSGLRAMFSVQNSLAMYPIYHYGSEEQKRKWLPANGPGRSHRVLRTFRARFRVGPGENDDSRGEARGWVYSQRS